MREMKVLKGISLFFVYPMAVFCMGVWCGVETEHFFYPGKPLGAQEQSMKREIAVQMSSDVSKSKEPFAESESVAASTGEETLCADTEYILEEVDVLKNTSVEIAKNLPEQYFGLNREQFIAALEEYEFAPPLSEQKRGFEGLEVISFSRERVKVRMRYRYVQPGEGFYLVAENHEIVVYLEDKETVYMNTGILLDSLPEKLQQDIIKMYYIEGEGNLYNFLETYSS